MREKDIKWKKNCVGEKSENKKKKWCRNKRKKGEKEEKMYCWVERSGCFNKSCYETKQES